MAELVEDAKPHVRRAGWRLWTLAGLGVGCLAFVNYWYFVASKSQVAPADIYSHVAPDIQQEIQSHIDRLDKESAEASVRNLSDLELFFWPGSLLALEAIFPELPFPATVGTTDLDTIMSNRRFLKVMQDLSVLPKDQAADLINRELRRVLPTYRRLFEEEVKSLADWLPPGKAGPEAITFQIGNNKDGSPTLLGLRYQILALILVAGNLQLEGTFSDVLDIAQEAKTTYDEYRQTDKYNVNVTETVLRDASLYHRQILGAGLVGALEKEARARDLVKKFQPHWQEKKLTRYSARATRYDLHGRIGVVPVDYSRGQLTVRYLQAVGDQEFAALLREAARIGRDKKKNAGE